MRLSTVVDNFFFRTASDEENRWKWDKFVEIGNTIHKIVGKEYKTRLAKYALLLSDQLIDNRFILNLPIKDQQIYETLLPKIAEYLDGNTTVIQAAVREYFLFQHGKAGLDESLFDIKKEERNPNWIHL